MGVDVAGEPDPTIEERAEQLRAAIAKRSGVDLRGCIGVECLTRLGLTELLEFAGRIETSCGLLDACVLRSRISPTKGAFEFTTSRGYSVALLLTTDASDGNLISDLTMWVPWRHFRSRAEVERAVSDLGDRAALYAAEITEKGLEPWLDIRGSESLAIASLKKIYILLALSEDVAAGSRSWSDGVDLRDEDRSAWSGVMHAWPEGTRVSLQAAAALMIGGSDNTAADMLLHLLGRPRLETEVAAIGHPSADRDTPYLTTAEAWKLKYHRHGELGRQFLFTRVEKRGAFLDEVVAPLRTEDIRPPTRLLPKFVDSIGWFASAKDVAEAFRRLLALGSDDTAKVPLGLLGISRKKAFPEWCVEYLGAKAGQEPGIRSVGYLARIAGRWHVVVCVANNGSHEITEWQFWAVAQGALAAAGRKLAD